MRLALILAAQVGGTGVGTGSAATTIVQQNTAATTIGIAGATGSLQLPAASLATIFSTNVCIGNSASAGIISAAWTPIATFATGVLTLDTGQHRDANGCY